MPHLEDEPRAAVGQSRGAREVLLVASSKGGRVGDEEVLVTSRVQMFRLPHGEAEETLEVRSASGEQSFDERGRAKALRRDAQREAVLAAEVLLSREVAIKGLDVEDQTRQPLGGDRAHEMREGHRREG